MATTTQSQPALTALPPASGRAGFGGTLACVGSKVARSWGAMCDQLAAVPAVIAAPIPTLTTSSTSSVQ